MKVIIAGSRDISDYEIVRQAIIASGLWKEYKHDLEIVSGGARGVDRLGEEFARKNGLKVHQFIPDWDGLGKSAGHVRNREMGDFAKAHGGALIALWDGSSPGTKGMIDYAKKIGLKCFVFIRVTDKLYRREE